MKKIISFFMMMFFVSAIIVFAGGQYESIWSTPYGFTTINKNNGVIGFQILTPRYEEKVN